jgi:hypothetical protein
MLWLSGVCYGYLEYVMAIWNMLWLFGIFCGLLAYFVIFWDMLWLFGIFCDLLAYFFPIWYIVPIKIWHSPTFTRNVPFIALPKESHYA